jgi:hypothetical protein
MRPDTPNRPFLHPYPASWPKPNPLRPTTLPSRISEDQKVDLYNRRITTRALAQSLSVTERWLSRTFTGKRPSENKAEKRKARQAFREFHANRHIRGEISLNQAADAACTSYSTIRRVVIEIRKRAQP